MRLAGPVAALPILPLRTLRQSSMGRFLKLRHLGPVAGAAPLFADVTLIDRLGCQPHRDDWWLCRTGLPLSLQRGRRERRDQHQQTRADCECSVDDVPDAIHECELFRAGASFFSTWGMAARSPSFRTH